MASTANKVGQGLAKVLGIDLHYRNETGSDRVTRGESVFTVDSADIYVEEEPTAREWLQEVVPSAREFGEYMYSLFPFIHWITRYNMQWLIGDLVAGMIICRILTVTMLTCSRYHRWCGCRASRHGLRKAR